MADADPWVGLIDPRAALAKRRAAVRTLASSSQEAEGGGYRKNHGTPETSDQFSQFSRSSQVEGALSPTSHNSSKDRKETCSFSLSSTYAVTQPQPGLPDIDFEALGETTPAKVAKRLNHESTCCDCSGTTLATAARALVVTNRVPSPSAHLSGPQSWRDGLDRLDRWTPPCPGFRDGEWERINRTIAHFMDHYAEEAARRGWTALDLFGVHDTVGGARVDSCGALMLPGTSVATALTADAITFGPTAYRRRAMPEAVLAWEFAASGGASIDEASPSADYEPDQEHVHV